MEKTVNRNLLKHAAGQHIFCPSGNKCGGRVMDYRNTVIATHKQSGKTMVACGDCWDDAKAKIMAKHGEHATAMLNNWEVIDGRPKSKQGAKPVKPEADPDALRKPQRIPGQKSFRFSGEPLRVENLE